MRTRAQVVPATSEAVERRQPRKTRTVATLLRIRASRQHISSTRDSDCRSNSPTTLFHARFDHASLDATVPLGGQLPHFRQRRDRLDQLCESLSRLARDFDAGNIPSEFLDGHVGREQLVLDASRVDAGLVDFGQGDDDADVRSRLEEGDDFLSLRLDAIVGSDDEDGDVRDARAARSHRREGGMAGRVEESDGCVAFPERLCSGGRLPFSFRPQVRHHALDADLERSDVLRDAAGFATRDRGGPQRIEQRGLAMVDVAKDTGNGRSRRDELGRQGREGEEIKAGFVVDDGVETEFESEQRCIFRGQNCARYRVSVPCSRNSNVKHGRLTSIRANVLEAYPFGGTLHSDCSGDGGQTHPHHRWRRERERGSNSHNRSCKRLTRLSSRSVDGNSTFFKTCFTLTFFGLDAACCLCLCANSACSCSRLTCHGSSMPGSFAPAGPAPPASLPPPPPPPLPLNLRLRSR